MNEGVDVHELVKYLESGDLDVVEKFKQVMHENLHASKDGLLLNALIDSYIQNKSNNLLQIVAGVNEGHCQYLFDRMNELLKVGMYNETTSLLAAVIRRQPPWLYKIVASVFFAQYLKCLKAEMEVVFVMSGAVIISMLLPCVPSLVTPHLGDILEIFVHMASFVVNKPGFLPEVLILHVQIGVYILFQRLYSMYPNNFLSYMRSCFGSKPNDPVFRQVIEPMLQFVKFHSGLIIDTSKSESEIVKWKRSQPHDIYAECQKISLDPLDAIKEATYTIFSQGDLSPEGLYPRKDQSATMAVASKIDSAKSDVEPDNAKEAGVDISQPRIQPAASSYLSSQDLSSLWSPSFLCGLSTPPSSRPISPANSTQDILSLSEFVQRPTTPVSCLDNKDMVDSAEDAYTSTPVVTRRRSGGELKKANRKSFPTSNLNLKSKSAESVEVSNANTERDPVRKEATRITSNITPSSTPPRRRKEYTQDKKRNLAQVSPMIARSELVGSSKASESASAPCTPNVVTKDSFAFSSSQQGFSDPPSSGNQSMSFTSQKLGRSAKQSPGPGVYKSDAILTGLSVDLLRVIQDLHEEVLAKQSRPHSQAMDPIEDAEPAVKSKFKSPFELLDEFIDCGSSLHSLQLSRIPITSQMDTDWTYFGGYTPADELSILRAQVNLFEVQLQYERQKCDQHVFRNRRLVGKVHKAQNIENELVGLKKTVILLESEINETKIAIKRKDEEIKRLREFNMITEEEKTKSLQLYSNENQQLKYQLQHFQAEKSKQDVENSKFEKIVRDLQHDLFNAKLEVDFMKPKLEINGSVQVKAENLAKELIAYQERYERLRRHAKILNTNHGKRDEASLQIRALRNELEDSQSCRESLLASLDAAKQKITDLESTLAKKELAIRDQKTNIESLCRKHDTDIKVMDERYKSLKKATQGMQSYILYLLKKVEDTGRSIHGRTFNNDRKKSSSASRHDAENRAEEPGRLKNERTDMDHKRSKVSADYSAEGSTNSLEREKLDVFEIDKKIIDDSGIESIETE